MPNKPPFKPYRLNMYGAALALIFLLSSCAPVSTVSQPASEIALTDCKLSAPGSPMRMDAKCGSLSVYENRAAGAGRQISLNLAIVPAVSRNPEPDPFFFLAGGPGEAATQSYVSIAGAFERIRQKRDIVLVDQRGTGKSHLLNCNDLTEENSEADTAIALQACLDQLDADPRYYTTPIAMDDLDQVREALGYEQINLYGASYGTRAALVYLRQFPEHVRSIILDGAVPLNWTLGPNVAGDAQRTIQMIFDRCASQTACQSAFPELPAEFERVRSDLTKGPIEVTLDHPTSGEPTSVTLNYQSFASTLHTLSYASETAALIPLLIHTAAASHDYRPIAAQTIATNELLSNSISPGMRFSVLCAEDVPFLEETPASQGYMNTFFVDAFTEVCKTWPRGDLPAGYKEPVRSDVPALILSGEADPVTPPQNGELAAQTLTNSLHLSVPGMGHINIFRGCIPSIAQDFIETGSIAGLDISCVQKIAPMPFFINFSGPTP